MKIKIMAYSDRYYQWLFMGNKSYWDHTPLGNEPLMKYSFNRAPVPLIHPVTGIIKYW